MNQPRTLPAFSFSNTVRLQRVMETYECDPETAQRYLDLRDEGYNYVQAQLMAGIGNPPEDRDD